MRLLGVLLVIFASYVLLCELASAPSSGDRERGVKLSSANEPGPCPVCGKKADPGVSCVREARIFYLCSPRCASKFEERAWEYIARMRDSL